jgi:hypothetical protein
METPPKSKSKPDPTTTPQSTPKKNITNREYYDGHGAEDETASIESLSSTDSYVEIDIAASKAKEKKQESPSDDKIEHNFVLAEESLSDVKLHEKEGERRGGSGGETEKLGEDLELEKREGKSGRV